MRGRLVSPCLELCQMDSLQPILKVLVVDDSAVYRKQVGQTLSYHPSYETFLACNGEEALRIYREKVPSIVVTDWMICQTFRGLNYASGFAPKKGCHLLTSS